MIVSRRRIGWPDSKTVAATASRHCFSHAAGAQHGGKLAQSVAAEEEALNAGYDFERCEDIAERGSDRARNREHDEEDQRLSALQDPRRIVDQLRPTPLHRRSHREK